MEYQFKIEIRDILLTDTHSDDATEYKEWLGLENDEVFEINAVNIDEINEYLESN